MSRVIPSSVPATWYVVVGRAGSTGCTNKAIRPLPDGSTCLGRAVQIGRQLGRVIVSTDYPRSVWAPPRGVSVVARPPELATSGARMLDVLADVAVRATLMRDDRIVLLQATSPMRSAETVYACLQAARESRKSCCTAMRYPHTWHPRYVLESGAVMPACRQELAPCYRPDGGAYVGTVRQILTGSWGDFGWVVSPPGESLSIDDPSDWLEACRRVKEGA